MQQELLLKTAFYQVRHKRWRTWKRVLWILSSVVVFVTTYALILPAITMEPDYICGMEAHVHGEDCYSAPEATAVATLICTPNELGLHEHTNDCYNVNGELDCGIADFVLHTHTSDCFDANGELVCTLPEIKAHIHGETCWQQPHIHTDLCYVQQRDQLLCTMEEGSVHTHLDTCFISQDNLICTLPEMAPHTHSAESCFEESKELVCTQPEVEAHTHSDGCYTVETTKICAEEEGENHTHTDACFQTTAVITCSLPETAGHLHSDACYSEPVYTLTCTIEETEGHTHSSVCYETVRVVTCAFEENVAHVHTDSCYICTPVLQCVEPTAEDGAVPVLNCEEQELFPHTHEAACFDQNGDCICGLLQVSEHIHGDTCFVITQEQATEPVLSCRFEEHEHSEFCIAKEERDSTVTGDALIAQGYYCGVAEHSHASEYGCFAEDGTLMCTMTEHEHNWVCELLPADLTAVETAEEWEADLPDLQGELAADLIAVAETQLGYEQSEINYIIENEEQLFYSRYGAWWDEEKPYGEWNAKFVSFCLHYAGAEDYPSLAGCSAWVSELRHRELYERSSDYLPKAGDIVFFDRNMDGRADRMGIVETVVDTDATIIEGDSGGRVTKKTYELSDGSILAYGALTEAQMSVEEEPNLEDLIGSEDADAWAVLVGPDGQLVEETEPEEAGLLRAGTAPWGTYGLRQTVSLYQNTARASGPLDLTPYIIAVTMYDEAGNPILNGSIVTEGDLIEFKIEYTITGQQLAVMNGQNVTVTSDTLVYKLPDTFKIVQSNSGDILNSSGQKVGTYEINSTTGYITMSFSEDYVNQNAEGIQIHGFISFFSTVTKITGSENENQDHQFTDKITLGVVIQEKEEAVGDLSVKKEKVSVDGENITYEVTVTSANGTSDSVVITDQMSKGLTFVQGISVRNQDNKPVNATFVPSGDKSSFTLTLPKMDAGDSYVVRYKCKADVDLLDADMTAKNTASVTSTDSLGRPLEDETTVTHTFDLLKKTGVNNEDGTITWTITINRAKADISGWVLEDIIRTGNESNPYTGAVTITDSKGNARTTTLPYTFPNGSTDTYTVTYTTTHDFGDGHTIYNSAILKDNDTDVTVLAGVDVGSPFTKAGVAGEVIQDEDGNYLLPITWTVTIDTTNAPIPGYTFFSDRLEGDYGFSDMYMTYDQLMAAVASIEAALKNVSGEEIEALSAYVYRPGYGTSDEVYNIIQLWGNVDGCQSKKFDRFAIKLSSAGIPQDHVLTFSYEAYGIFPNNIVSTTTFKNNFGIMDQYEAEGKVDYITERVKGTKHALKYFDPDDPDWKDEYWFWGLTDWNSVEGTGWYEYEKLHDSYLAWAIELSVPPDYRSEEDVVVYEDLPDGVSVKSLKMPFQSDIPTTPMALYDMAPGETYTHTFTLYPATEYGQYQPQGGQQVSITVKVTEDGDLEMTIPGIVFKTMAEYATLHNETHPAEKPLEEWYAYLYIFTQIDEDFEWPKDPSRGDHVYVNAFENRFTIETEDGAVIDIGSQTQVITKDESKGAIRKEAATKDDIVTYSVLLNAYGRDLVENANNLAIHDELTYTSTVDQPLRMRLVPGSVKLYEARVKSDGSYVKGAEVTANYKYAESSTEAGGTTTWVHTIDLTVPDDKSLLLEYAYKANGKKNDTHNVLNTCTISGVAEGSVNGAHNLELQVRQSSAQADADGIMIYKVDAQSDGIFLENARFNIYIWNETEGYIIVHNPKGEADFVTNTNGMILLDSSTMAEGKFAYNTAYYIVEVESPNGYYVTPEPYFFYIVNEDTVKYPPCIPEDFNGHALTRGDIIYRQNTSAHTEISIEKYWQNYEGDSITVTVDKVPSVTVELWQMLENDPGSKTLYDTYIMTPDKDGNWSLTVKDLPKAAKNQDGTRGTTYLYYVKEVQVSGYGLESSENNNGINSGTIKLTNRETNGYELPETGGGGTMAYTTGGLLLMAVPLLVGLRRRRRREADG